MLTLKILDPTGHRTLAAAAVADDPQAQVVPSDEMQKEFDRLLAAGHTAFATPAGAPAGAPAEKVRELPADGEVIMFPQLVGG